MAIFCTGLNRWKYLEDIVRGELCSDSDCPCCRDVEKNERNHFLYLDKKTMKIIKNEY